MLGCLTEGRDECRTPLDSDMLKRFFAYWFWRCNGAMALGCYQLYCCAAILSLYGLLIAIRRAATGGTVSLLGCPC
jgi:hypothetical protein